MANYNKIIKINHRGFIIDIDAKKYFSIEPSNSNRIGCSRLGSSRKSYREKFVEYAEEAIKIIDFRIMQIEYTKF